MTPAFKLNVLLVFLAALLPPAAGGEEVSFKIGLSAAKPKLAEQFTLRVELSCPADYDVKPDTSSFQNDVFELTRIKRLAPTVSGAVKTEIFELDASAFDIGISTFPETVWLLTKGADIKKASSPAFAIEILPLFDGKKEKEGIKDIYPPFRFIPWLQLLLGALAAAAAAYLLYKKLKKTAPGPGVSAPADTRTPYQAASDALNELLNSGLWDEGKVKEFYSRLSDIFRNYLDAQFSVKAELMTTNDITRGLRKTGAEIKTVIKTRELLENSDLVKFARFRPGQKDRDAAVSALKELLVAFTNQKENAAALNSSNQQPVTGNRIPDTAVKIYPKP
ncbi:MAG: hypothetical protein KKH28_01655 [Elusimicrobia bacterium]|nr:hypothetical protein [Elusimicrobiota bacterium]